MLAKVEVLSFAWVLLPWATNESPGLCGTVLFCRKSEGDCRCPAVVGARPEATA